MPGSSTSQSGHNQPCISSTHAQRRSKELLYLRAWPSEEKDQRGPEGGGRDSDTNTTPTSETASPSRYSRRLCLPVATALAVF